MKSSGLRFCSKWCLMDLKQIQKEKSTILPIQWDSKNCVVFVLTEVPVLMWPSSKQHLIDLYFSSSPRVQTWPPGRTTIFRWTNKRNHFEKFPMKKWFSGNGLRNVHWDPFPNICWDDVQPGFRVSFQAICGSNIFLEIISLKAISHYDIQPCIIYYIS